MLQQNLAGRREVPRVRGLEFSNLSGDDDGCLALVNGVLVGSSADDVKAIERVPSAERQTSALSRPLVL